MTMPNRPQAVTDPLSKGMCIYYLYVFIEMGPLCLRNENFQTKEVHMKT